MTHLRFVVCVCLILSIDRYSCLTTSSGSNELCVAATRMNHFPLSQPTDRQRSCFASCPLHWSRTMSFVVSSSSYLLKTTRVGFQQWMYQQPISIRNPSMIIRTFYQERLRRRFNPQTQKMEYEDAGNMVKRFYEDRHRNHTSTYRVFCSIDWYFIYDCCSCCCWYYLLTYYYHLHCLQSNTVIFIKH